MAILVYRDRNGYRDFVGKIDYAAAKPGTFTYDKVCLVV